MPSSKARRWWVRPHPHPVPYEGEGSGARSRAAILIAPCSACVCSRCLLSPHSPTPSFPPLTGRIVDEAALLTADDRRALEQDLKALEEKSTDQLVVYTTRSLQGYPIEDFGYRLGRVWAIGQKDKNNGVILIVAPSDRKVRIEVGRGLEPQLTDLMTKLIIENAILPAFRRNDFAGGIKAGVRDIRDVLLGDAEAVKQRARGGAKRSPGGDSNFPLLILALFILIAISMVWMQSRQTANPSRAARDRRRSPARRLVGHAWTRRLGRQLGRLGRRRLRRRRRRLLGRRRRFRRRRLVGQLVDFDARGAGR